MGKVGKLSFKVFFSFLSSGSQTHLLKASVGFLEQKASSSFLKKLKSYNSNK